MQAGSYLCLPFLFALLHHATTAAALPHQTCNTPANIEETCQLVVDRDPSVGHDFCMSSLRQATAAQASAAQASVGLHDLASIATKLAIDHAISTEAKVEELMELETDSRLNSSFEECLNVYSDAVEHMRNALDNISNHVYRRAVEQMSAATSAEEKCSEAFKDSKASFPLVALDQDYTKLAIIAKAILSSLE